MQAKRKKTYILAAAVALLFSTAAILYLLTTKPHPVDSTILNLPPSEREIQTGNLRNRIQVFEQTRKQGYPVTKLEVSEKEINTYLQSSPEVQSKLQANGASNTVISLRQGQIEVSSDVQVKGIKLPVTVAGEVIVDSSGKPQLKVQDIKIGRMGLPQSVADKIAAEVAGTDAGNLIPLPAGVTDVRIEDGRLVITGLRQ